MKKQLFIIMMLFISLASFSQTWYKTTSVSVKIGSRNYSDWYSCPSSVRIDVDAKTIKIWNDIINCFIIRGFQLIMVMVIKWKQPELMIKT